MQIGQIIIVRTDPGVQFVAGLAQNAILKADLTPPPATLAQGPGYVDGGLSSGATVKSRLRSVLIASVENLAWEIGLWGKDTFNTSLNPNLVFPCGFVVFTAGQGLQIAATGLWYYYRDGLDIPYVDLDRSSEVHLSLVNRSVGAKSVGAFGSIMVQLNLEPTLGW